MTRTDITDIKIENLSAELVGGVYEIEKACFSHPWSENDIKAQLDIKTSHFIVACDGKKAVGYMGIQIFSHEGYVTNIAVLPEYRRRKIASLLIENALQNDMDFLTLEVRESNAAAISLYEKFKFTKTGIRPGFYTNPDENALIMTHYKQENI